MIRKIIPLFIIALLYCSCQNHSIYQNAETLPSSGWPLNQVLYFNDSLPSSAPETMHFEINIRHNNLYPYQNIWLYIETENSEGAVHTDSINWKLSEANGKWLGKGWGSLYNLSYQLPDLKIKKTGSKRWFEIRIEHGLSDKVLMGIEDIGIRLYCDQNTSRSNLSPLLMVGIETKEDKK
ncbi:MAG: gliding motility lipoprotein GldH [Bacteroidales bacterium]|nr:gliding motility lipoprotein GldH [Bacteroidales bacterium]